ncbi:MAG TPA: hypothetical protein VHU77_00550 [Candidatus Limnocylindria bacterium]|jgi:hypothetical protein|nr:hypothetical protein [Candidatus Limnocylindria bacterium]
MSVRQSFDHRLNDWLDEGPQVAPYDLLLAVLEELPSHHQERRWLFGGKWRIPMNAFARLGLVAAAVIAAVVVGAVAISGMRSGPSIGNESTPTPSASSTFTSRLYPYSISVPAGWTATWAAARWDGSGAPDIQDLVNDNFISSGTMAMIVVAAPTRKDLATYTADGIAATYAVHKDTCPAAQNPESVESITVGGEPARLESINCGILINVAYTVHAGQGYRFTFRDPAVHAATNTADKATFMALLASVQFK